MRTRAICLVIASLLLAPALASANGRAPLTNGIHFAPGDAHSLYVASTFGLLVSHDDGTTFDWVCEDAIGYAGTFDPIYAVASDGTIYATTYMGLHVSRDGGCSFQVATSELSASDPNNFSNRYTDALDIGPATTAAPTGEVWVGTADNGKTNDFYSSVDGGMTFASKGLQSNTIWYRSVKVAPSDAKRIYVTGYQVAGTLADGGAMPPTAHLLRSDDDGATWSPSLLAGVTFGPTPLVLVTAIDPTDEDKLFVTSLGGGTTGGDGLYLSTDGGATLKQVLITADTIRDIVIRDANHIIVATLMDGTYASTDGGTTFTKQVGTPQLACLGERSDGSLYGCGANWQPDFKAVASSSDGSNWNEVFRFVNLNGPVACPATTVEHTNCCAQWTGAGGLQAQFGAPASGALACNFAVDGAPADAPAPKKAPPAGGCCDAGPGAPAGVLFGLGVGALLLRRRRR